MSDVRFEGNNTSSTEVTAGEPVVDDTPHMPPPSATVQPFDSGGGPRLPRHFLRGEKVEVFSSF
jgi:hypothetical protein